MPFPKKLPCLPITAEMHTSTRHNSNAQPHLDQINVNDRLQKLHLNDWFLPSSSHLRLL